MEQGRICSTWYESIPGGGNAEAKVSRLNDPSRWEEERDRDQGSREERDGNEASEEGGSQARSHRAFEALEENLDFILNAM